MPASPVVEPSPGKLAPISVKDAFGLPDLSFADSLKGVAGVKVEEPAEEAADETPAEEAAAEETSEESSEETQAAGEQSSVEADQAEAAKNAAALKKKNEAAAAEKTKKAKEEAAAAAAKKTPKTEAEKKAAAAAAAKAAATQTPAQKAAAEKAAKAAADKAKADAAAAAAPKKVKVGDKEFTEAELAERLKKAEAAEAAAAEAAKKKSEAEEAQTPEQKAAEEAEDLKKSEAFIASATPYMKPTVIDADTMDKILAGGEEAVTAFNKIRQEDMARTLMAVRKDLDTLYQPVFQDVADIKQAHIVQRDRDAEASVLQTHPYLKPHMKVVKQYAASLFKSDPERVRGMTREEFFGEAASLATEYIRQFNDQFGRDPTNAEATADAAAGDQGAVAAAAAAEAEAAAEAAKKAAAAGKLPAGKRKTPAAPAPNLPGAHTAQGGGGNKEFQKAAVASLL